MLDLVVSVRPCPRFGDHYREELEGITGQQQFPYMVDENTGTSRFESDKITEVSAHARQATSLDTRHHTQ